jgi:hypothetical protein
MSCRPYALLLSALSASLLVGCGAGHDDVSEAATRFLDAAASGDTATACSLLTPRTRDDLVVSDGGSCEQALPVERLGGSVSGVDVWSDQSRVDTDGGGTLFLTEFDSGWLVSAAGCEPDGDAPYQCVVSG